MNTLFNPTGNPLVLLSQDGAGQHGIALPSTALPESAEIGEEITPPSNPLSLSPGGLPASIGNAIGNLAEGVPAADGAANYTCKVASWLGPGAEILCDPKRLILGLLGVLLIIAGIFSFKETQAVVGTAVKAAV